MELHLLHSFVGMRHRAPEVIPPNWTGSGQMILGGSLDQCAC